MMDSFVSHHLREDDWALNRVQDWQYKLCWKPQTCFLTGKQLWGKRAYHGTRIITGPGVPIHEDYWIGKNEFMIWKLTK